MQTFSINNFKPYEEPKLSFIETQRFKNMKYHSLTENKGLMSSLLSCKSFVGGKKQMNSHFKKCVLYMANIIGFDIIEANYF